ncbi:MAG: glycosyltransferase family 4 protein [Candidatus Bathyarchaeota archaeon]|nr:glycosyltransferase family 4 protein [Candidatus Bathyarchaeota archaeon]
MLEVYNSYLPKNGGVQNHIHDLCDSLVKNGHSAMVLSWVPSTPKKDVIDGIPVKRIRVPRVFSILRYPAILFLFINIFYVLKKNQIDIIHAHDYLPGTAAALAGLLSRTPTLVSFHLPVQKTTFYAHRFLKPCWLVERALRFVFNYWVSAIICVSRFTLDESLKLNLPRSKLVKIYNWVNLPSKQTLPMIAVREKFGVSERPFILSTGRLYEKQKPFSLLIHAFKLLVDDGYTGDLLIVGNGPDKETYRQLSRTLCIDSQIHILDNVSNEELSFLYDHCVLFVLPSFYEGLPMVLLEAMSHSKPIVSTRVGGIPEVVRDGYNGLLAEARVDALYNSLKCLMSDDTLRITFGNRSKELIKAYFSLKNLDKTLKLIKRLSTATN